MYLSNGAETKGETDCFIDSGAQCLPTAFKSADSSAAESAMYDGK